LIIQPSSHSGVHQPSDEVPKWSLPAQRRRRWSSLTPATTTVVVAGLATTTVARLATTTVVVAGLATTTVVVAGLATTTVVVPGAGDDHFGRPWAGDDRYRRRWASDDLAPLSSPPLTLALAPPLVSADRSPKLGVSQVSNDTPVVRRAILGLWV
jgi:hypothetical protein